MQILVVCGAGASSTFVAQRLRRAAAAAGFNWIVHAGTEHAVFSAENVALVLLGPHLADRELNIRAAVNSTTRVSLLPDDAFTDFDGSRTLRQVREAMSALHNRKELP